MTFGKNLLYKSSFSIQIVFICKIMVYEVLNSCVLRRTCTEYVANKHISRILKNLFLFHLIHTYASIHRFPRLHHYPCEIYHPYWFCTGFQLAGTPSTLHSKHSSPPCTSISPHHPQSLLAQGSTLFWNLSDKLLKKDIYRYTKIQV